MKNKTYCLVKTCAARLYMICSVNVEELTIYDDVELWYLWKGKLLYENASIQSMGYDYLMVLEDAIELSEDIESLRASCMLTHMGGAFLECSI